MFSDNKTGERHGLAFGIQDSISSQILETLVGRYCIGLWTIL